MRTPLLLYALAFVVRTLLMASFTTSCSYMTCTLDGSGSTDDGTIVSYAWSTGNPASPTATGKVASTTYPGAGSYSVTLTVTDDAGQASSVTNTVTTVDNPPVADFTWSCASFTCTLDGRSSTDDGQIVQYFWTLDRYPGPTATGSVVSVFYWHASTRNVTLTVTDNSGKTASVTKVVTVQ